MTTTPPDSTTTDQDEPLEATMPGFRQPRRRPGPDRLDPSSSTIDETTSPAPGELGPGWSPELGPEGPPAGPDAPRSPRPTTSSPASTVDLPGVEEITRTLVGLAAMAVRAVRRRRRPALHPAAWVADDDDRVAIGDPLARIVERHAPLDGDDAGDVVDGMAVLVGTAGYAVKGLQAEAMSDGPTVEIPGDVVDVEARPADVGAGWG